MNAILTAVIPVVIIGLICAVVLVTASILMAVKEDERIPKVRECLPGANCGACGYAGCDGYAKAIVEDNAAPNLCVPGAKATAEALGEVLGIEVEETEPKVAFVHCAGDCEHTEDIVEYEGVDSCKAAKLIFGSKGKCSYGCLGLGDCKNACPEEAIYIQNGVAKIGKQYCVGCGICVKTCPNKLISLIPNRDVRTVACSNQDKGAVTRKVCSAGCIACRKCVKACPNEAISIVNNHAVIDGDKCTGCGSCESECVVGGIQKN
ncbi:MAG: RnfABCDGE type electron transport complex subunit B [Ruminococcus sp.]|nr:RnfABCDGE type electron transport complex subunit B [Ruminococcus sp.]